MNKKQEMWHNAFEKIDEKYIKEAAEYASESEAEEFHDSFNRDMRGTLSARKSGNLLFVIAAAAAVICCTVGIGFFLGESSKVPVEPSGTTTPVAAEPPPSEMTAEEKPLLTLDAVRELAKKGADLTWSDFEQFEGNDVGHGLYIRHYRIDDEYSVYVGGTHPDEKPWYVRLHRESNDSNYSLLENGSEGLEEFISDANSKRQMTLDDVRELVKKGSTLSWSDFEPYIGEETDGGIYRIIRYSIDDTYYITVNGEPDQLPWQIRFYYGDGEGDFDDLRNLDMEELEELTTTTAQATHADSAVPESSRPTLLAEKIGYTTENTVDKEKIEKELWKHCGYDYTKADSYPLAVEQEFIYSSHADMKKNELGHQYLYLSTDYKYIGTNRNDWLCIANYQTDVTVPSLLYSEIVLIKNNKITEWIYECENSRINDVIFSNGEYFMTTIGGLYELHPETKTAQLLISDSYGKIIHIDKNIVIFGGEKVWIYNRKTGEIAGTGINYSAYGSPDYEIRFRENRLEYVDKDTEKGMVYDLETREIYEGKSLEFYDYAENDKYIVVPEIKDYKYSEITVTRKSDGFSKTFDVSEITEKTGCKNGLEFVGKWTAFSENRIFLYPQNAGCWYALNFETEEAALCDFAGYDFLYYSSEADCFYSDTRGLTAVIKLNKASAPAGDALTLYIPENVTKISDYMYSKDAEITAVVIPANVEEIGEYAFINCPALEKVTIAEGVKIIGDYAFHSCPRLTAINIPDSVTSIGGNTFTLSPNISVSWNGKVYGSQNIHDLYTDFNEKRKTDSAEQYKLVDGVLTISDGVTKIEGHAFENRDDITEVVIPDTVTEIGDYAFAGTYIEEITLPAKLEKIGEYAFYMCYRLEELEIPDSVTEIGYSSFSRCGSLRNVKLSAGLEEISGRAFSECTALKSVDIPEGVREIGQEAFSGCGFVDGIRIPSSVTEIDAFAFANCIFMKNIAVPEGVKIINDMAFSGNTRLETASLPDSLTYYGYEPFYDSSNVTISYKGKNYSYANREDIFYQVNYGIENSQEFTDTITPAETTAAKTQPPDDFTVSSPVNRALGKENITIDFSCDEWPEDGHSGIDISWDGCHGSPVYAAADGTVTTVQTEYIPNYDKGMYVIIDHGNGYETLYSHCSAILVREGATVRAGDVIAQIGNTGWSTGAHLHFELRKDGTPVDPMQYIK